MEPQVRPSQLVAEFRDEIVAAAGRFHASEVRVFGSAATNADSATSDLDLLVHFSHDASLYDQIALAEYLEQLLGVRVDIISDGAPGAKLIKAVRV